MYSAFVNMWIRKIHTRGLAFASLNNRYLLFSFRELLFEILLCTASKFYSILYLILSTTELLYSKSLNNTTLQRKYNFFYITIILNKTIFEMKFRSTIRFLNNEQQHHKDLAETENRFVWKDMLYIVYTHKYVYSILFVVLVL